MRSDQELRQLAADVIAGKVFGSWAIPPELQDRLLRDVFVQLRLVAGDRPTDPDVAAVYEYAAKRVPGSEQLAGHPVYWTCQTLTAAEIQRMNVFVHQGELDLGAMIAGVIVPGVCVRCGWVEGHPGATAWADSTRTLCAVCSSSVRAGAKRSTGARV